MCVCVCVCVVGDVGGSSIRTIKGLLPWRHSSSSSGAAVEEKKKTLVGWNQME